MNALMRYAVLMVLTLVFAGALAYSAGFVRISVDNKDRSEFTVLKATLTDSIRRDASNALYAVTPSTDVGDASQRASKEACPT